MTIAKPVYGVKRPAPVHDFATIAKALTVLYGEDLFMIQWGDWFVFYTPGDACACTACEVYLMRVIGADPYDTQTSELWCFDCGRMDCPKAANHDNPCSESGPNHKEEGKA